MASLIEDTNVESVVEFNKKGFPKDTWTTDKDSYFAYSPSGKTLYILDRADNTKLKTLQISSGKYSVKIKNAPLVL